MFVSYVIVFGQQTLPPLWGGETDLKLSQQQMLLYWAGIATHHRKTNRLYPNRIRIGAAQRELSPGNDERFLPPGYGCVPRDDYLRRNT